MIEISLSLIDWIAALFAFECICFMYDWYSSGKNPYGEYCKYRKIGDKAAITLFITNSICGPAGFAWLIFRYGGLAYTMLCNSVVFVP